jgi:uncharacterized Fe-S cluster-containing protein
MKKGPVITFIVSIVVIGLLLWGYELRKNNITSYFRDTDIACLTNGHANLADHIHPWLTITIDGEEQVIPANVGIDPGCMSEIHTHDDTGELHVESFIPGRVSEFDLSDFFLVSGLSVEIPGKTLEIVQDGEIKNSVEEVKFIDGSQIELNYTTI